MIGLADMAIKQGNFGGNVNDMAFIDVLTSRRKTRVERGSLLHVICMVWVAYMPQSLLSLLYSIKAHLQKIA
jgi:hypothetical protein